METTEALKFESNVPVNVALKYESGKLCANQRVMYTLTDGQKMFLDPPVAARVDQLQVKPGEALTICKIGKGKDAQWAVGRSGETAGVPLVPAASKKRTPAAPLEFPPKPVESPNEIAARRVVASADNSMRSYLKAAVSAVADTEKFAYSIGRELIFSSADVLTAAIFLAQMGGR